MFWYILIASVGILILAKIHRARIVKLENKINELEFMLNEKVKIEFIKMQSERNKIEND